jgi:hypothetical protein
MLLHELILERSLATQGKLIHGTRGDFGRNKSGTNEERERKIIAFLDSGFASSWVGHHPAQVQYKTDVERG